MGTPRLSVIYLSLDGGASLRAAVRRLSLLSSAHELEIVLALSAAEPLTLNIPSCFAGWKVVRAPLEEDFGKARGAAVRAASAPFVVFGEDHSFPTEGWTEGLLAHLEAGAAAVGPQILVANPATSVSWSEAILCYGDFLNPRRFGSSAHVPWHNSAYRREALLALGEQLDFLLQADSALHAAMAALGSRFTVTAGAATEHCNASLLRPHWVGLYWGNRLYGANRASLAGWRPPRRLFYALCWPAIVALRFWRSARICLSLRDRRVSYLRVLPLLAAGSAVAAAGETWGYLFGVGRDTLRRRAHYELSRALYVRAAEVSLLTE